MTLKCHTVRFEMEAMFVADKETECLQDVAADAVRREVAEGHGPEACVEIKESRDLAEGWFDASIVRGVKPMTAAEALKLNEAGPVEELADLVAQWNNADRTTLVGMTYSTCAVHLAPILARLKEKEKEQ